MSVIGAGAVAAGYVLGAVVLALLVGVGLDSLPRRREREARRNFHRPGVRHGAAR
jgi:hypothetical protein